MKRLKQIMDNNTDKLIIRTQDAVTETVAVETPENTISFMWYILFATSILLISFSLIMFTQQKITIAQNGAYAAAIIASQELATLSIMEEKKALFTELDLESQSAIVYDITTKKTLYERNSDMRMPLASITKVMTALLVVEYLDPNEIITVTPSDLSVDGISGFYINEKWKMIDLLSFSLITSSNDGMTALARTAGERMLEGSTNEEGYQALEKFITEMNSKANEIGLFNTTFSNPTGLDEDDKISGAYSTAGDMVILLTYIYDKKPTLLSATQRTVTEIESENNIIHTATNTNAFVQKLPGIIVSKTGFTDLAGGNLAIIYDSGIGTPVVVVVLGSSFDGRFTDVEKLVYASLSALSL